jgi:hypothetical protein
LLCVACGRNKRPEPPADLLTKEQMANILYDMFVLNSAKGSSLKILQENGIDPDVYVLEKHGIDSARFVRSNDYFAYSHQDYSEIMTIIQERVETEKEYYEQELEKENNEAERIKDSLKKAQPKKKSKSEDTD